MSAQTKTQEKQEHKHELGLNVTNLLTDLLGNNNRTDPGIYLLSYKYITGKKAFRLGLTTNVAFKSENTFGFDSNLNNQNFQLRVGRETRHDLSPKFQYYIGLDAIGGYKLEESIARTSISAIIQKDKTITIGGGPVLGFQFKLYERLLIGTEGSFYAAFNRSSADFTTISNNGIRQPNIPSRNSKGANIQTNLPKFLFLILKF